MRDIKQLKHRFDPHGSKTVFNIWLVERVHLYLIFTKKGILWLKKLIKGQKKAKKGQKRPKKANKGQ